MNGAVGVLDVPSLPALAVGSVSHARKAPLQRSFEHAHYQWLVDIDDLPDLPGPLRLLARFDARDHLDHGRLGGGIRGDLGRWLMGRGIVLDDDDRVLMLAHARTFGHVFDPLTVYWVIGADHALRALVLEVHNTYGERHAYLIDPADLDERGRAVVPKDFYVSPFNDTTGQYVVRVRLDRHRFRVGIALEREGERVFAATTAGRLEAATNRSLLRVFSRHLFLTHRVSLLIRWHGVRLWLSRLPVLPRPHHTEEAVR